MTKDEVVKECALPQRLGTPTFGASRGSTGHVDRAHSMDCRDFPVDHGPVQPHNTVVIDDQHIFRPASPSFMRNSRYTSGAQPIDDHIGGNGAISTATRRQSGALCRPYEVNEGMGEGSMYQPKVSSLISMGPSLDDSRTWDISNVQEWMLSRRAVDMTPSASQYDELPSQGEDGIQSASTKCGPSKLRSRLSHSGHSRMRNVSTSVTRSRSSSSRSRRKASSGVSARSPSGTSARANPKKLSSRRGSIRRGKASGRRSRVNKSSSIRSGKRGMERLSRSPSLSSRGSGRRVTGARKPIRRSHSISTSSRSPSKRRKSSSPAKSAGSTPPRSAQHARASLRSVVSRRGVRRTRTADKRTKHPVTLKSLSLIPYSSYSARMKPGERKRKMMSDFLAAHEHGAGLFAAERDAAVDALFKKFQMESFWPQTYQIRCLQFKLHELQEVCRDKLHISRQFMTHMTDGIDNLLRSVRGAGARLVHSAGILSFDASFDVGDANSVRGVPNKEVYGPPEELGVGSRKPPSMCQEEVDQIARIKQFFSSTAGLLQADELRVQAHGLNSQAFSSPDTGEATIQEKPDTLPCEVSNVAEATSVEKTLNEISDAMVMLLDRVKVQGEKCRNKLRAQQQILDDGATRQRLADDIVAATQEQGVDGGMHVVEYLRDLDMELRSRMDAVEADVRQALHHLICSSADLCIDKNANCQQSSIAYRRKDCYETFMNTMERNAVEQASLLRTVQDGVLELWRTRPFCGREEKHTLLCSGLPEPYVKQLETCERDTLLRLLLHLSLESNEAVHRLMGALDERNVYLQAHPDEAKILREAEIEHKAVSDLLQRLHTQGRLRRRHHNGNQTLARVLQDMVEKYDRFSEFEEDCAQVTANRSLPTFPPSLPFFDAAIPVPVDQARKVEPGAPTSNHSRTVTYSRCAAVGAAPMRSSVTGEAAEDKVATACSSMVGDGVRAAALLDGALPSLAPNSSVIIALQRSNPSTQHPLHESVSVVGTGRWRGKEPLRTSRSASDSACIPSYSSYLTFQRTSPHSHSFTPTTLKSNKRETILGECQPGVPIRKGFAGHIHRVYNSSAQDLVGDEMKLKPPERAIKRYADDWVLLSEQRKAYDTFKSTVSGPFCMANECDNVK